MINLKYLLYEALGVKKSPKPIKSGKTQCWYGRVNSWSSAKKSVLRQDLDNCVKYGVSGYHIELVGWSKFDTDPTSYRSDGYYKTVRERYEYLAKACRARGLWLFVSVLNDNAGKSGNKYNPRLEQQQDNVQFALNLVKKHGPRNVIVQCVAEIQTKFGENIENAWSSIYRRMGFNVVYNGGGRAEGIKYGANWYVVHPSSISRMYSPPAFMVSDHSLILRELCKGGNICGMGNPDAIRLWRNNCVENGNPVVCFYHYGYDGSSGSDKKAIRAIGGKR